MKKILLLLLMASLFTNCKKGDTGPQGEPGINGKNGSANIQNYTFTTTTANWLLDQNNVYVYNYPLSAITTNVMDQGAVMVYIKDATAGWIAMPITQQGVQINFAVRTGILEVNYSLSSGAAPSNPGGQQFRVVIIPNA